MSESAWPTRVRTAPSLPLDGEVDVEEGRAALAQQPAVDRSRVDFLYYEGNEPYYDYEYYNDYNEVRQVSTLK